MSLKTFIIAEAGVNHNGSFELAKELINVAANAGADAVKFQTFRTEDLVSASAPKANYQKNSTPTNQSQYEMLKSLEFNDDVQIDLQQYCQQQKIIFLSTPFDLQSVDLLNKKLNLPLIKIASGEITNAPLLLKIARTGKPVFLSTGMSTLGEIEAALSILAFGYLHQSEGIRPSLHTCYDTYYSNQGQKIIQDKVSLLHCTTEYPAPFEEVNLRAMNTLRNTFELPVGYSDHTSGIAVSIAAVACGARIVEKHFTLDKNLPGPDHQASLEPAELNAMVKGIREVEAALGEHKKLPTRSELANRPIARRSLVVLRNIREGEIFDEYNLGCKRPGTGVSSIHFWSWMGKQAEHDYDQDDIIEIQ